MSNNEKKPDIWERAYPDKEHCSHCHDAGYKEGFFDAGVSGLLIIILMIFAYGAEVMR